VQSSYGLEDFALLFAMFDDAAVRVAFHQNGATAIANHDHRLTHGASFDFGARSWFAGGLAAVAFVFVNGYGVAIWTRDLRQFWTRLLFASPSLAASVRCFEELVASSVARRRFLPFARDADAGGASAGVFALFNPVFAWFANMDGVVIARFILVDRTTALVQFGLIIDQPRNHTRSLLPTWFLDALRHKSFASLGENLLALAAFVATFGTFVVDVGADPLFAAAVERFLA